MEYISVFIAPLFVIVYLWVRYGWRDAYRKAREKFVFMILVTSVVMASMFFLARSASEEWEVSNGFAWVALFGVVVSLVVILTLKHVRIKKYAHEYPMLEQETMYETGRALDQAYAHRVVKFSRGKPSKLTTAGIDLDVVDSEKELKPELKREILDILNGHNADFYEYGIWDVDPAKTPLKQIENLLSPFYKGVLKAARDNLRYFDADITFEEAMKLNGYVVEYAVLYILEKAREIKNTPMGNLGSLVASDQDEHMLGACGSLGFTSVGRYGIAIYVGYRMFWHEQNQTKKEN